MSNLLSWHEKYPAINFNIFIVTISWRLLHVTIKVVLLHVTSSWTFTKILFFCLFALRFLCGIVKLTCKLPDKSFINVRLRQINNLYSSVSFYKNLHSAVGNFVHSVVKQHLRSIFFTITLLLDKSHNMNIDWREKLFVQIWSK